MGRKRVILPLISCLFLWGALTAYWHYFTANEYELRPAGDAAYYADMAQAFYLGSEQAQGYPSIHSRRILAPLLVGYFLRAEDAVEGRSPPQHKIQFNYKREYSPGWRERALPLFGRLRAWRLLDFIASLLILLSAFGILCKLFPPSTTAWLPAGIALGVSWSPTLGRLYIAWPYMNDLTGISLGLLSLLLALDRKILLSAILFGVGMLARENLALTYPCFLWAILRGYGVGARRSVWLHAALSATPYLAFWLFPAFERIVPLSDNASQIQETRAGFLNDYLGLLWFHLTRTFSDVHGVARQVLVYWQVVGPLLLVTLRFYPWNRNVFATDRLLWSSLLLIVGTAFYVDRYVVYAVFPILLLARHAVQHLAGPLWVLVLSVLYASSVEVYEIIPVGRWLQVEFMRIEILWPTIFLEIVALLLVGIGPAWLRPRSHGVSAVPDAVLSRGKERVV